MGVDPGGSVATAFVAADSLTLGAHEAGSRLIELDDNAVSSLHFQLRNSGRQKPQHTNIWPGCGHVVRSRACGGGTAAIKIHVNRLR